MNRKSLLTLITVIGLVVGAGCASMRQVEFEDYETANSQLKYLIDRAPVIVHAEVSEFGVSLGEMKIRVLKVYQGRSPIEVVLGYVNLSRDTPIYGRMSASDIKTGSRFVFFISESWDDYSILSIMDHDTFSESSKIGVGARDLNAISKGSWRLPEVEQ